MKKVYKEKRCLECGKMFVPNNGRQKWCLECRSIVTKRMQQQRDKQRYIDNPEKEKERHKQYYERNKEQLIKKTYEWQKRNPNKVRAIAKKYYNNHKEQEYERIQQYRKAHPEKVKQWTENGREKKREYDKVYKKRPEVRERNNMLKRQRRKTDIQFKLELWARDQIHRCLNGVMKDQKSLDILGYTIDELRAHIEAFWEPNMSWDNYGNKEGCWCIDHIKPLSKYNFINEDGSINYEIIKEANSLENLRPLDAIENMRKGNRYEE